jgi:hypothetical protein
MQIFHAKRHQERDALGSQRDSSAEREDIKAGGGSDRQSDQKCYFGHMANITIAKDVQGEQVTVTVTWRTSAKRTSAYYFCESAFSNIYVVGHAKVLLKGILDDKDVTFEGVVTWGETGIAFLVTIPAKYTMQTVHHVHLYSLNSVHHVHLYSLKSVHSRIGDSKCDSCLSLVKSG